jgi:ABC-type nickel/cobalt efflux system permease component RcnA
VPCPDAVVVLLIAVAMNRIGLGLAIIAAFSVGLAAVLIALGALTVTARPLVERIAGGTQSRLVRMYLPIGSAVLVMLLGLALMLQVLVQTGVAGPVR